MQSQRKKTIAVGGLMLVGFGLLGYLIVLFGDAPNLFGGGTYPLTIRFAKGVSNTREGTEVMLSGKRIGQVRSLAFVSDTDLSEGVSVTADISSRYLLPRSARAYETMNAPVMGRATINLAVRGAAVPGDSLPLDGSVPIPGEVLGLIENMLSPTVVPTLETTIRQIGELADALKPLAARLESLVRERPLADVDNPETADALANLSTVVQRFDQTLKHVNEMVGDPQNQENIRETLAGFRAAAGKLGKALDEMELMINDLRGTNNDLKAGIAEIRGFMARTDELMQGLSGAGVDTLQTIASAATAAETMLNRVNEGKGTLGRLVNDNRLYESMVELMLRMEDAVKAFRETMEQWQRGELKFKL